MSHQTTSLRKRTKTVTSSALELPEPMNNAPSNTAQGSQLPSPLSSIDENMVTALGEPRSHESTLRHSRRRRSSASTRNARRARSAPTSEDGSATDAQWIDIPLAVALIPPLGSFLTGGDLLRDLLLFILLFFYLHQLIKLPWELYLASRPRGRRISDKDMSPDQERLHDLVAAELRTAEFCYLTLSVFTPLFGAALLRYVGTALTGKDYISWFSTGVFVLVTGVRPWRHLVQRLRARTEELQDSVHAFRTEVGAGDMPSRVASLEEEIGELKMVMATKIEIRALHEEFDESLDVLDAAVGRQERTMEVGRRSAEEKIAALEKTVGEAARGTPGAWTVASTRSLFEWIRPPPSKPPVAANVSPSRATRYAYRPRLEPVREEEDGGVVVRGRATSTSTSKARRQSLSGGGNRVLDMVLFPFSAGRTLLWALLDFLQRRLV